MGDIANGVIGLYFAYSHIRRDLSLHQGTDSVRQPYRNDEAKASKAPAFGAFDAINHS
jgi:hypothetical protein